jgi:hypothetical protein
MYYNFKCPLCSGVSCGLPGDKEIILWSAPLPTNFPVSSGSRTRRELGARSDVHRVRVGYGTGVEWQGGDVGKYERAGVAVGPDHGHQKYGSSLGLSCGGIQTLM